MTTNLVERKTRLCSCSIFLSKSPGGHAAHVPLFCYHIMTFDVTCDLLGTLRSDNGDVHENVDEKQTSHHYKLFRDYPNSPCYLKEGHFGWS